MRVSHVGEGGGMVRGAGLSWGPTQQEAGEGGRALGSVANVERQAERWGLSHCRSTDFCAGLSEEEDVGTGWRNKGSDGGEQRWDAASWRRGHEEREGRGAAEGMGNAREIGGRKKK